MHDSSETMSACIFFNCSNSRQSILNVLLLLRLPCWCEVDSTVHESNADKQRKDQAYHLNIHFHCNNLENMVPYSYYDVATLCACQSATLFFHPVAIVIFLSLNGALILLTCSSPVYRSPRMTVLMVTYFLHWIVYQIQLFNLAVAHPRTGITKWRNRVYFYSRHWKWIFSES